MHDSKDIFFKNIEVLSITHPLLLQQVLKTGPGEFKHVKDVEDDVLYKNNYIYKNGNKLEQNISDLAYPKMIFLYALGLGKTLKKAYDQITNITEHLFIFERYTELFFHSLHVMDWTTILKDPRVELFIGLDVNELGDALLISITEGAKYTYVNIVTNLFEAESMMLDEHYYKAIAERFQEVKKLLIVGDDEDSYRGFMNIINNLIPSLQHHHFDSMLGLFEGYPGIVVSSGPSLEKSLPWLKQMQNRAVIICADSALRKLLQHGVTPHIVGCLERVAETFLFFKDIPDLSKTFLLAAPILWPQTYQNYPGPVINLYKNIGQFKWFYPEYNAYVTANSVAHQNYLALEYLGCNAIYLVGQDLAYDRFSTKTHVDGIPDAIYQHQQKKRLEDLNNTEKDKELMVEGNNGEPILTSNIFIIFRKYFEHRIRSRSIKTYNVIPKDYGAKIDACIRIDPEELLNIESQPREIYHDMLKCLSQEVVDIDLKNQTMMSRIQTTLVRLQEYQEISLNVLDSISQYIFANNPEFNEENKYDELFRGIEKIVYELMQDEDGFYYDFFYPQVMPIHCQLAHQMEEFLKSPLPHPESVKFKVMYINRWFSAVYFWSGRMKRFIERKYDFQKRI